jgi:hypothetical protein
MPSQKKVTGQGESLTGDHFGGERCQVWSGFMDLPD